jgi:cytochrome P450
MDGAGEPFIPQTIKPPARPLGFFRTLATLASNPIEAWPEAVYQTPYSRIRTVGRTTHFLRMPEHVKGVLVDYPDAFAKSPFQLGILGPLTGQGLLTAEGDAWRFQRRAASPAFNIEALRALVPVFVSAGENAADRLLAEPASAPRDVLEDMQRATLEVIVETILGGASDAFSFERVAAAVSDYVESLGRPDPLDILGAPPFIPRIRGRRGRRAARLLRAAAQAAVAGRGGALAPRRDFLEQLMLARDPETGAGLSPDELRDNVVTFIAAGHETTALALTYALYLIANAPDVQARLVEEVGRICGDGPITAEAVERMEYHEMTLKEAMRLYPPVAAIDRVCLRDVSIGEIAVRRGDLVLLLIYPMHRHALLWEQPEAFLPERFSAAAARGRHRFQFLPFGGGGRVCIGSKFAYLEAAAILAALVRRLAFLPNPAHKVHPRLMITLRPDRGMPLYVRPRTSPAR